MEPEKFRQIVKTNLISTFDLAERFHVSCRTVKNWAKGLQPIPEDVVEYLFECDRISREDPLFTA
jgi:DNA-binding transcriptional regulator YiaG